MLTAFVVLAFCLLFPLMLLLVVPFGFALTSVSNLITLPLQMVAVALDGARRRNHALEHATVNVLEQRYGRRLLASGFAEADGFFINGVGPDPRVVLDAAQEALRRLQAGESELAIHPRCGTVIVAGQLVSAVTFFVVLFYLKLSFPALILYLFVYALMNLGAFAVVVALEQSEGEEIVELEQFRGLGRRHMGLGLLLGFFLLSLAGFPPTAGFFAKFFLFSGAIFGGQLWLVVAAVVLSIISVYYYVRYIIAMFMQEPVTEEEQKVIIRREPVAPIVEPDAEEEVVVVDAPRPERATSWMVRTALLVTAVLVLGIGLFPNPILNLLTP
mgnify:CR=1 FL=1